jgi:hypothetical protein
MSSATIRFAAARRVQSLANATGLPLTGLRTASRFAQPFERRGVGGVLHLVLRQPANPMSTDSARRPLNANRIKAT